MAELCEAASQEAPQGQGVRIANFLCNGNYAVSGGIAGCEAVERLAKGFKARMTVRLAVAGAFHTDFMAPAREQLQQALAGTTIQVGDRGRRMCVGVRVCMGVCRHAGAGAARRRRRRATWLSRRLVASSTSPPTPLPPLPLGAGAAHPRHI